MPEPSSDARPRSWSSGPSGAVGASMSTEGAPSWTGKGPTVVAAVRPTRSVALPVADVPSSSIVAGPEQLAIPEPASAHTKSTVTGPLYQPFWLGAVRAEPVTTGSDWSAM